MHTNKVFKLGLHLGLHIRSKKSHDANVQFILVPMQIRIMGFYSGLGIRVRIQGQDSGSRLGFWDRFQGKYFRSI